MKPKKIAMLVLAALALNSTLMPSQSYAAEQRGGASVASGVSQVTLTAAEEQSILNALSALEAGLNAIGTTGNDDRNSNVAALTAAALGTVSIIGSIFAAHNLKAFMNLSDSGDHGGSAGGALSAGKIAAALRTEAARLANYATVQTALLKAAADVLANATRIDALLSKLHLFASSHD